MDKVAEKAHAELGPSKWDQWSNCPGSIALSRGQPRTTSIYAAEGTVAHEVADRVLREDIASAADLLGQTFECDGHSITVDEVMVEAVGDYVEYVRQLAPVEGDILFPEQQVGIGHLTGETGATGTSDTIVIANGGKLLHVVDLKYGKGVRVNAEGNGQGRMYALGALEKFKPVFPDIEEVEIHIIHPRIEDGYTSETLTIGELEKFKDEVELAAGRVNMASFNFKSDDFVENELRPGEKQCKFCPAAAICPALKAWTSQSLAPLSTATMEDFADLTLPKQASSIAVNEDASNEKLAEFLRAVPLIEGAITAVRAEVERRLFAGEEIPGFYLGVGRKGNRAWGSDAEAALKKALKSAAYEKKLIGVPAAEKLLKKQKPKVWAKLVKEYITQPDGKPSVCMDGDKNPPYQISTAEDFADLTAQSEAERLLS